MPVISGLNSEENEGFWDCVDFFTQPRDGRNPGERQHDETEFNWNLPRFLRFLTSISIFDPKLFRFLKRRKAMSWRTNVTKQYFLYAGIYPQNQRKESLNKLKCSGFLQNLIKLPTFKSYINHFRTVFNKKMQGFRGNPSECAGGW